MPLILNIDTATEYASVCLSNDGKLLAIENSVDQKNHASFIQPAIKKIFSESVFSLTDVDAIAVSNGPGSYTGLRVGLSSAKGLCYALNKPLILLNTLQIIANSIAKEYESKTFSEPFLICPMIDARRMEVFTTLYDTNGQVIIEPNALVLTEQSFAEQLQNNLIVFGGSGSSKFKNILQHTNAIFVATIHSAEDMITLSEKAFTENNFGDLAYAEPLYLKEFFSPAPKE